MGAIYKKNNGERGTCNKRIPPQKKMFLDWGNRIRSLRSRMHSCPQWHPPLKSPTPSVTSLAPNPPAGR